MTTFNRIIVVGNLTKDPEVITTQNNTKIANIRVAINRQWTDVSGEKREETTFVDVKAYKGIAETIGKYFKKGKPILVEGRLAQDNWEKNGEKRSKLYIVAESFQFVGSKEANGNGNSNGNAKYSVAPSDTESPPDEVINNADAITNDNSLGF